MMKLTHSSPEIHIKQRNPLRKITHALTHYHTYIYKWTSQHIYKINLKLSVSLVGVKLANHKNWFTLRFRRLHCFYAHQKQAHAAYSLPAQHTNNYTPTYWAIKWQTDHSMNTTIENIKTLLGASEVTQPCAESHSRLYTYTYICMYASISVHHWALEHTRAEIYIC